MTPKFRLDDKSRHLLQLKREMPALSCIILNTHIYQIKTLCTSNRTNVICELYLHKVEKGKETYGMVCFLRRGTYLSILHGWPPVRQNKEELYESVEELN